ncbi:hypothetical protein [Oryza sativa Japonica Group]|uniref:RING-type domain-containing protein n=1 Tax=Oryza sativa subsp. japonica TaxID=39947 RepID=Q657J4_ORYSJ|nr:hypothetical protein [Oryza sativa Japonica Group]
MAPLTPQVDTNWSAAEHDHIAIDIGDSTAGSDSDDVPSCVVCTEPIEWVAVGPCGHRVVCSPCAARLRSGPNPDHRCCVCRTLCSTVVITKAATAAHSVFTFSDQSSMPVAAAQDDGRPVGAYWCSAAMSAYFDDKKHYDQVTKQVVVAAADRCFLRTPPRRPDVDASPLRRLCVRMSWRGHVLALLVVVLVTALVGGWVGYLTSGDEMMSDRIGIVAGIAALWGALAAVVYVYTVTPISTGPVTIGNENGTVTTSRNDIPPTIPPTQVENGCHFLISNNHEFNLSVLPRNETEQQPQIGSGQNAHPATTSARHNIERKPFRAAAGTRACGSGAGPWRRHDWGSGTRWRGVALTDRVMSRARPCGGGTRVADAVVADEGWPCGGGMALRGLGGRSQLNNEYGRRGVAADGSAAGQPRQVRRGATGIDVVQPGHSDCRGAAVRRRRH